MTFITRFEEARKNSQDGIIGVTWHFRVLAFDVLSLCHHLSTLEVAI